MKGRDLRAVLWTFEAYKLKHNKPDVTIVRTTPGLKWPTFRSAREKYKPEWKVPYAKPSGMAEHFRNSYTEAERQEIRKRANALFEFWNNK